MNAAESYVQSPAAKAAYDQRWQRVIDCVNLKQPDRMPTAFMATFWLAKYGGISYRQLMYDYEKTKEIAERAFFEFEPDAPAPTILAIATGNALEAIDFKQLKWPGHGVRDDQPYQYLDREYMKPDEYDEFLFDPTAFYLQKYLPRVAGVFEGLEELPYLPGLHYFRLVAAVRMFARPRVRAALHNLMKAAEVVDAWAAQHADFTRRMAAKGFPMSYIATAVSPYDLLADYFRGATGMMKDLYRNKDKLLAMLDKAATFLVRQTIAASKAFGHPIVFIPIHWAPDRFMSGAQFEHFWWPSFRKMLIGLIDGGIIPMPLWEADCTKRLEVIRDIPPGKCIYWFERTDMVKAFEVLGDVVALRGNISPSLLNTGTPAEVDAAVRHLAENVFHKGGKLILDGAFGIPDETPVENVRAMFAAARKYAS
ncbi:MAG TPA: uroporphyrinogen decarboxylase family protein [Xanthobacteraceae bacterium]|nr:uroporphyrinogen decarboxylase family protein [Xanthobacteraceae bacterium]